MYSIQLSAMGCSVDKKIPPDLKIVDLTAEGEVAATNRFVAAAAVEVFRVEAVNF
jgi:hypothetical protein